MKRSLWLVLLLGCSDPVAPAPAAPPVDPAVVSGADLYLRYCALCHGERGQGYLADHANAIANSDFLELASDSFLKEAITHGRPGTPMSAWGRVRGGPLDDGQITDLVAFLRSRARRPVQDLSADVFQGDPTQGAIVYAEKCQSCHRADGRGDTAPGVTNPQFLANASDGYLRASIRRGRRGTPMKAFEGELTETQIHDVVAWIRSQQVPVEPVPMPGPEAPALPAQVVINPDGAAPDFTLREERFVSAAQVRAAMRDGRKLVIADARASSDYLSGHITGSVNVPFYGVEQLVARLPNDGTWIIAYCACPHAASGHVVDALRERGYRTSAVLDEGIGYWRDLGWEMEGTDSTLAGRPVREPGDIPAPTGGH